MAKPDSQPANNDDRAKRTLYVTGFNSKCTTKKLLKELFTQGGPVADITMFDTHAYVRFQHPESVPYCLALFNEVELFGDKLRLNPRHKSDNTFSYMKYLAQVRNKLRDEYMNKVPPNLPAKQYQESPKKKQKKNKKGQKLDNRKKSLDKRDHQVNDTKESELKAKHSKDKDFKRNKRRTTQRNQPHKNRSIY